MTVLTTRAKLIRIPPPGGNLLNGLGPRPLACPLLVLVLRPPSTSQTTFMSFGTRWMWSRPRRAPTCVGNQKVVYWKCGLLKRIITTSALLINISHIQWCFKAYESHLTSWLSHDIMWWVRWVLQWFTKNISKQKALFIYIVHVIPQVSHRWKYEEEMGNIIKDGTGTQKE